ncbi:zinc knuckle CX2CX4HX4C containing protein [Tanacetum coccineum]
MDYEVAPHSGIPLRCRNFGGVTFGKRDQEYIVENNPKVTNEVSFDSDPNFSSPNTEPNAYCNNNLNEEYDSNQNTTNDNNEFRNAKKKETYVSMARKDEIPRKLKYKSLITNDSDGEVVVFDELLVKKGIERWNLNASGYFVRYRMAPNDLRDLEGLNSVIDQGPWMVNKRPLIVQKWNHEIGMQMVEHSKLPIWVRMTEVPLEAWSSDGISALASSLVEMNAEKEFKQTIEVQYRDKDNKVKGTKTVNVSYDWKPAACTHCWWSIMKFAPNLFFVIDMFWFFLFLDCDVWDKELDLVLVMAVAVVGDDGVNGYGCRRRSLSGGGGGGGDGAGCIFVKYLTIIREVLHFKSTAATTTINHRRHQQVCPPPSLQNTASTTNPTHHIVTRVEKLVASGVEKHVSKSFDTSYLCRFLSA